MNWKSLLPRRSPPLQNPAVPYPSRFQETEATVTKSIPANGAGRVRYQATTWSARSVQNEILTVGEKVYVVGRCNSLTLLVSRQRKA